MATQQGGAEIRTDDRAPTVTAAAGMSGNNQPVVAYVVENHPADSRVNLDESGKVQTLTSRMGTGGGNVPMVMEGKPVYCLQGNGIDRADTAGCNGKGVTEDVCYTLNTIDRPAVAFQTYQDVTGPLMANSHPGSYTGQDAFSDMLVAGKEQSVHYIVRRLTPTECARLQGFADRHGHLEQKTDLTEEEYSFWLNVRNTHAAINGKAVKDYTKAQMLTWYNKLWTDAAEYKMWGNGIALPPALYCMQGIVDVLTREEDDSWML
jgi:DNA (cytosine-5)-methyltransferase 1